MAMHGDCLSVAIGIGLYLERIGKTDFDIIEVKGEPHVGIRLGDVFIDASGEQTGIEASGVMKWSSRPKHSGQIGMYDFNADVAEKVFRLLKD